MAAFAETLPQPCENAKPGFGLPLCADACLNGPRRLGDSTGHMRSGFPIARRGQCIGLFGGSFDPPHEGHVHLTLRALRAFDLDGIWWLVSPANPLKSQGPASLERRIAAARALMDHPRVTITGLERDLGTRFTAQTLQALGALYPGVRFTWLMGADNLATIHRWERWQGIFAQVPVGIIARPGNSAAAHSARAARVFRASRLPARRSHLLARSDPPAWCYLPGPLVDRSSTAIRASGAWPR